MIKQGACKLCSLIIHIPRVTIILFLELNYLKHGGLVFHPRRNCMFNIYKAVQKCTEKRVIIDYYISSGSEFLFIYFYTEYAVS